MERRATVKRVTAETNVEVDLLVDGKGRSRIATGIGFLDHMLCAFARHGFFDLNITAVGDLQVDGHHTAEDVGIVLGNTLREALGNKSGIRRFGSATIPMDEALVLCAVDLSGRAFLVFDAPLPFGKVGDMDTQLFEEFFRAFSTSAGMNLHMKLIHGKNVHHCAEAMFKALGRALAEAVMADARVEGIPSTKGVV